MHLTNKNTCAPTPPMGWNSYDYYDTTVDEAAVKANADYMAKHLKAYPVVCKKGRFHARPVSVYSIL